MLSYLPLKYADLMDTRWYLNEEMAEIGVYLTSQLMFK